MNGTIFSDGTTLEYNDIEIQYLDTGVFTKGKEGKLFIPYGSMKFISEE